MTNTLRSWGLLGGLSLALLTTTVSCSDKKDDPTVAPATTGAVEGTVSPAGAVITVTATNAGGLTFLATPNATGAFSLPNLAPGTYTLSFGPANGYVAPATRTITVVAGQAAAAGTVVAASASDGTIKGGTVSWMTDGVAYTSAGAGGEVDAAQHNFSLSGVSGSSGSVQDMVTLGLAQSFNGPGVYTLGGTYSAAVLTRMERGFITASYRAGSNGTLTITSYNATAGTISGTFGFIGTDYTAGPARTATITSGTFNVYF